jgi:hypothetical protein
MFRALIPRDHLALAHIGSSLPLEVPIDRAALHKIAPRSAHRADDDFLVLEGGFTARIRPLYNKPERKRLEV